MSVKFKKHFTRVFIFIVLVVSAILSYFTLPLNKVVKPSLTLHENPNKITSSNTTIIQVKAPIRVDTISEDNGPISDSNTLTLNLKSRPQWRIDGTLVDKYPQLKERFNNGDNAAGYILAMNLRYCWSAAKNQGDFKKLTNAAIKSGESDNFINNLKRRFDKCNGVNEKEHGNFFYYMRVSSEQGFVPSQEMFGNMTAEFFMKSQHLNDLERAEYITSRDSFNQQKLLNLNTAADHGSLLAITQLASLYNSQNYGANGLVKTFANNQVILAITDDNDIYNRYQWFQERLTQKLTSEEIAQAFEFAELRMSNIHKNGTLYSIKLPRKK